MNYIFFSLGYLLVLFGISRYVFEPTYLYYELPWLDIPMHFLGGLGVAALYVTITLYRQKEVELKHLLVCVLAVALGWELYEYAQDILWNGPVNELGDTLLDIVVGIVGAVSAYFLVKK